MHGTAKEQAEIAGEKDIVETSTIQAMGKNKYGNVIQSELEKELNINVGDGKTEIIDNGDTLVVKFVDSGRYYEVDNNGNVSEPVKIIVDNNPSNIKIGINGEELKGTEESPFEIWCIEDLVEWSQNYAKYKNSYIKLGRTLNFSSNLSYTDGRILNCSSIDELKELLTNISGSGFTPIAEFSGNFDGKGFEIQNVYVNTSGYAGLFCYITSATIANLTISGMITSNDSCAGGLVGYQKSGSILENICSDTRVTGTVSGGIIGESLKNVTIKNCCNLNDINGVNQAGGVLGFAYGAVSSTYIESCYNIGKIKSDSGAAGGILGCGTGYSSGEIIDILYSYNIGEIMGFTYAGGIIGLHTGGSMTSCYNVGKINSGAKKGGICNTYQGAPYYSNGYTISLCFCVEGELALEIDGTEERTSDYMKTENFVDEINEGIEEKVFSKDKQKINNGYPILSWQSDTTM